MPRMRLHASWSPIAGDARSPMPRSVAANIITMVACPKVVLINRPIALGLGLGQNEDDGSLRRRQVAGTHPDGRELL